MWTRRSPIIYSDRSQGIILNWKLTRYWHTGTVFPCPEGMKGGIFEYIMKPIDIGELTAKIDKANKKSGHE